MGNFKIIVYLVVLLILIQVTGKEVKAFEADVSISKVFLWHDEGYLGKIHLDLVETQGFYFEMLQIGQYYQQIGMGLEYLALKQPQGDLWLMLGRDEYELLQTKNSLLRTGLRAKIPIVTVELNITADVMMDDLTGIFMRYQVELRSLRKWLQTNIGCGNLLGSRDGYAFWVGFSL